MWSKFISSGVDLMFWAHEHSYERLWPLYDWQVRYRNLLRYRNQLNVRIHNLMVHPKVCEEVVYPDNRKK